MKQFFILLFFGLIIFSCSNTDEPTNELMKEAQTPNGKKLYNRYCVVCHGDNGDAKIGSAFDLSISTLSNDAKFNIIKNGSDNKHMRAFGDDLNEKEISAIVTHLETLKK